MTNQNHALDVQPTATWVKLVDSVASKATLVALLASGSATFLLAVHITVEVFIRNTQLGSLVGTTEIIAQFWMIILVFFAIAAAQRPGEHMEVTFITHGLPIKIGIVAKIIALFATIIFAVLLGAQGGESALHNFTIGEYAASNYFPVWPARFAVPISALILVIQCVSSMCILLSQTKSHLSAHGVNDDHNN